MASSKQSHTVIEEIEDGEGLQSHPYDDQLERVLIDQNRDGYKFLTAVFDFVDRHSKFFQQPDASKQLARLLRDVKQRSAPTPTTKRSAASSLSVPSNTSQVCRMKSSIVDAAHSLQDSVRYGCRYLRVRSALAFVCSLSRAQSRSFRHPQNHPQKQALSRSHRQHLALLAKTRSQKTKTTSQRA